MDLVDLYSGSVFTRVGDLIFKLRLFDLHAVVWAESFFSESDKGGLNVMYHVLGDIDNWRVFSSSVADIAFYLAEDLEIKTPEEFKEKINESNPTESIAYLSESIKKVLKKSFPKNKKTVIDGGEIFKNATKNEEQKPTDWAKIYADFYRFGGMTIDQFYSLTMAQVDEIYKEIDFGRTKEKIELMQFHCSIKGVKKENWPKMPKKQDPEKEINEDEIKRRQEEHEKLFQGDKWREM